ncbi:hypothetical protein CEXT_426751 [Caerostris extrusa]|uniref:Uncharacterized protein n=1 Tax=Caerostris extrusa TaxID=172846 RepID=A0AAV4PJD8_CAEEX|nr:hypothetical protein CEXT_426751 [Caerostris extrusa]
MSQDQNVLVNRREMSDCAEQGSIVGLHGRFQIYLGQRFMLYSKILFPLLTSWKGSEVMIWAGIFLDDHTKLYRFHGAERYWDEILVSHVISCAGVIDNYFIQMNNNVRPRRARLLDKHLEDQVV